MTDAAERSDEQKQQQPPTPPPPPPPATAPPVPPWWAHPPKRSRAPLIFAIIFGILFSLSVLLNGYLLFLLAMFLKLPMETTTLREGKREQVVAVYEVSGIIGGQALEEFDTFFRAVKDDKHIKAVVLRVDSPGGGVSASDQIYDKVRGLQKKGKKVVVSMGGLAASGGYYISAPADKIIAEPTTTTGSIGVIMVFPVIKGTLEKIGMEMVVLKSRHAETWKDERSPFRAPTDQQRQHLLEVLDKAQLRFEQIVKDARGGKLMPRRPQPAGAAETQPAPEFEAFNGKVYAPDEAKALGLIDAIGYQDDAIDAAASLAGLPEPKVVRYRKRKGLMEALSSPGSADGLRLGSELLREAQTPRILLMWKVD